MSYDCTFCSGTGETTVCPDADPQHDRQAKCRECHGSGRQPCSWCRKPAKVRIWVRDPDNKRQARLLDLCDEDAAQVVVDGDFVGLDHTADKGAAETDETSERIAG